MKGKVIWSVRDGIVREMNIMLDGQVLKEMEAFKYLGALVTAGRGVMEKV